MTFFTHAVGRGGGHPSCSNRQYDVRPTALHYGRSATPAQWVKRKDRHGSPRGNYPLAPARAATAWFRGTPAP